MFLLDTPILLELRRAKAGEADANLTAWARETPRERLFLSALSLFELEGTATRDEAAGAALRSWLDAQVLPAFEGHILPVDAAVARRRRDLPLLPTRGALFAATALEHGLTLVTLDRASFKGARVRLLDPTAYRSEQAAEEDDDWRTAGKAATPWLRNLFIRG